MNRQFSSNTSLSLIQLDDYVEDRKLIKCNSLVEMFDPIFDKISKNNSLEKNLFDSSASSDDIFAPLPKTHNAKKIGLFFEDDIVDDIFVESENNIIPQISYKESIYPSLKSIQDSYSSERYSVFTSLDQTAVHDVNYPNLRPSIFKEIPVHCNNKSVFCDTYACKDMERLMKSLSEFHMQSLNLQTDERSHLVFDQVFQVKFNNDKPHPNARVIIKIPSTPFFITGSSFSIEVNPYTVTERKLMAMTLENNPRIDLDSLKLYFRIWSRSEYLKQGDFPLIYNHSFFQNYRTENDVILILEYIDFTDEIYRIRDEWHFDISSTVYQMLEKDFHWVQRSFLEEIFSNLNNYRNSIVSQLRLYRSPHLDLSSIEASIEVFRDQCRSICVISNNLYTASISQKTLEIDNLTASLISAFLTKNDEAITRSVESMIECLDHAIKLMTLFAHQLTVFCNCNFSMRPEKLSKAGMMISESGGQPISKMHSTFFINLKAICGLANVTSYTSYSIKVTVKVGRQRLSEYLKPKAKPFCDIKLSSTAHFIKPQLEYPGYVPFNETITFENLSMDRMPLETSLVIVVLGKRLPLSASSRVFPADNPILQEEEVAWGEISLFDSGGILNQGGLLVGLWTEGKKLKWSLGMNKLKSAAILELELPTFHVPVKCFREPLGLINDIPDGELTDSVIKEINVAVENIWMKNISASVTKSCDILWKYRIHLMDTPRKFIALSLAVATSWPTDVDTDHKDFLLDFLERCHRDLHPISATEFLHLLGPQMPIVRVRQWAVQCLRDIGPDGCMLIIPALIEALKYDTCFNSSGLEEMLFYFSINNINFSTSLFWQLSSIKKTDYHGYKSIMLLGLLRSIVGEFLIKMWNNQLTIVDHLQIAANAVKSSKGSPIIKKNVMHNRLEELYDIFSSKSGIIHDEEEHPLCSYRVPYAPGVMLNKLEMKDCSYFNSFTMPLRIVFKGMDNSMVEVMFKSGDDLRQDILILQLFRLMDDLWISEGLDLRMVHYKVMSTGSRCGLVELVGDCTTLRKIQEMKGGISAPLTNASVICEWLKSQNNTKASYVQSVRNFLLTTVACCVSTYLLGIGDRHNDNIMIQTTGRMFHIDFAKILGDVQTIAGIKRDRVPFVLTQDMVFVLEDYVPQDNDRRTGMQLLIDTCCEAFNIIRRHWCSLVSVLTMAADANIPGVNSKTMLHVVKMLRLQDSDTQASEYFTDLIKKCVSSISTPFNFLIHNLAQMKYSSNNEGSLFSFTPKIHSNGPRILEINIKSVEKLRNPNKSYVYNIRVTKEERKLNIVFRRYEHFIELATQLASMFPLSVMPKASQPIIQAGAPTTISAAEARRIILQQFVIQILNQEDEICQGDHMKTFFHSTLFDENTLEEQLKIWPVLSKFVPSSSDHPEIQVKFNLTNNGRKLEIFVKHARNLISPRLNEPPNAYVKTYLLPNYGYSTKKKTSVVMHDSSPSFNDIITYNDLDIKRNLKLEISVWHNETLGENFCLGKVTVAINKSMSGEEKWLRLQIQSLAITQSMNRSPPRNLSRYDNNSTRKSVPGEWKNLLSLDNSRYV